MVEEVAVEEEVELEGEVAGEVIDLLGTTGALTSTSRVVMLTE